MPHPTPDRAVQPLVDVASGVDGAYSETASA
jgi:hypothetical protein